jgi:hypothetical protein
MRVMSDVMLSRYGYGLPAAGAARERFAIQCAGALATLLVLIVSGLGIGRMAALRPPLPAPEVSIAVTLLPSLAADPPAPRSDDKGFPPEPGRPLNFAFAPHFDLPEEDHAIHLSPAETSPPEASELSPAVRAAIRGYLGCLDAAGEHNLDKTAQAPLPPPLAAAPAAGRGGDCTDARERLAGLGGRLDPRLFINTHVDQTSVAEFLVTKTAPKLLMAFLVGSSMADPWSKDSLVMNGIPGKTPPPPRIATWVDFYNENPLLTDKRVFDPQSGTVGIAKDASGGNGESSGR